MTKIVEIRQDRNLIRSDFDGYKLSLDPVPVLRQAVQIEPHKASPSDDQYSLLHVELFSLQNLLVGDPWARTTAYFVNARGEVVRCGYDDQAGRSEAQQVVFHIGKVEPRINGDYNYSLRFISEKYGILCDGVNLLFLCDTGDRLRKAEWKEVARAVIRYASVSDEESERGYVLYDCRMDIVQEQKRISVAIGRVQRVDKKAESAGSSHFLHIHWGKWIHESATWAFSIAETLESRGSLYYCAFEPRAESLVISSNRRWEFMSLKKQDDLVAPVVNAQEKSQFHDDSVGAELKYTWSQNSDEVILNLEPHTAKYTQQKSDYDIIPSANKLLVKHSTDVLFDGEFFAGIDSDLTTWTLDNAILQITMVKSSPSLDWPTLLAAPVNLQDTTEEDGNTAKVPLIQQPIANLEAPIEDCDFPMMGTDEDEIKIERFHLHTKTITHAVLLGSIPPLFATSLRAGFPTAIATRQDVDASLWLQQYNPSKPDEWCLRHEGNLHAFAYVQASKQQRKFIDCSPDMNYGVICESHRHIFLYKSQYDTANGLRKRSGRQVSIGKQHLITLAEDDGEVMGMVTAPSVITILTDRVVLHLQIN